MRRDQRPDTVEAISTKADGQTAVAFLLDELIRAAIPDLDGPGAVLAGGNRPFELRVLERMILDVHGEMALSAAERDPFGTAQLARAP